MVSPESKTKPPKPPRSKPSSSGANSAKLKTVIRRLPPNLPEDVFWASVQEWVSEETVLWKQFHQGKIRKGYNKENIPSRAYIAFRTPDVLATFSQAYDGHTFRDKAGNESRAVVEFAPYQKLPSEKKKVDSRAGTIEQDEDFLSFIATLNAPAAKPSDSENLEALVASTQAPLEIKTTPLLEALIAEKSAAKDKEAILRNHAHYRNRNVDREIEGGGSKRDREDSRKGGKASSRGGRLTEDGPSGSHTKKPRKGKKGEEAKEGGEKSSGKPSTGPPSSGSKRNRERERDRDRDRDVSSSKAPQTSRINTSAPTQIALITDDQPPLTPTTSVGASTLSTSAPRRRPAIGIGLQSRQFEAALSGVVGGGRPPRRERKERDKERSGEGAEETGPSNAGRAETEGRSGGGEGRSERKVSGGRPRSGKKDKDTTSPTQSSFKILRRESFSTSTSQPASVLTTTTSTTTDATSAPSTNIDPRSTSPVEVLSGGRSGGGRGERGERGRGSRGTRRGRGRGRGGGTAE